jgi:hypothetical protein
MGLNSQYALGKSPLGSFGADPGPSAINKILLSPLFFRVTNWP